MEQTGLPNLEVKKALEAAKRTPGWNNRRPDVRRFELANRYGRAPCVLYVVPARCWAHRRYLDGIKLPA